MTNNTTGTAPFGLFQGYGLSIRPFLALFHGSGLSIRPFLAAVNTTKCTRLLGMVVSRTAVNPEAV